MSREKFFVEAVEDSRRRLDGNQVDASCALMTPRELSRYHTGRRRILDDVLQLWEQAEKNSAQSSRSFFAQCLKILHRQSLEASMHADLAWQKETQQQQDEKFIEATRIVKA